MFRYILRRLIFLIFLMVGVTIVVFLLSHAVPSDPVVANLSQRNLGDAEMVAAFRAKWGLDQPLYRQYFTYMSNLVQGDLGLSIRTQRPVAADLARYFPATIELAAFGILFATLFGVLFGVISAIRRNTFADHFLRGVSVFGVSVPSFWLALIMLFIFYLGFGVAPGPGRISPRVSPPETWSGLYTLDALRMGDWALLGDALSHLVLPGICLGMFTMGLITRTTRSSLLEVLSLDFIRTARAKGLAEKNVIRKHALGNALIPVVTVVGVGFGNLLSGMVFVETIFAWPGIGQYAYQSAKNLDFPAIVGVSLLIAVNYVLINLTVDILYGLLDPRVRYDR